MNSSLLSLERVQETPLCRIPSGMDSSVYRERESTKESILSLILIHAIINNNKKKKTEKEGAGLIDPAGRTWHGRTILLKPLLHSSLHLQPDVRYLLPFLSLISRLIFRRKSPLYDFLSAWAIPTAASAKGRAKKKKLCNKNGVGKKK